MLVLDPKSDPDLEGSLRYHLAAAGRADALRVISDVGGNTSVDMFRANESQNARKVADLIATCLPVDGNNRYWDQFLRSLLRSMIEVIAFVKPDRSYGDFVEQLEALLLGRREVSGLIEAAEEGISSAPPHVQRSLRSACMDLNAWERLDSRTRSNHQSMAVIALQALRSAMLEAITKPARYSFDAEEMLRQGQVVLGRSNSFLAPAAARLWMSYLKGVAFDALMSRAPGIAAMKKPFAIVSDEFPLSVIDSESRYSDRLAMQILRDRGGIVIAATQGIGALDIEIGEARTNALLANFNSILAGRNRDQRTEQYLAGLLGARYRTVTDEFLAPAKEISGGRREVQSVCRRERLAPAIRPGLLAELQTGEFVGVLGA
ncbi:MAG: type IV secretory system conjugative DNA transfer family protein, partial [Opitutales bacterium]